MPITSIFDRTAHDIRTRTSKAFFNIEDWDRIQGNAYAVNLLLGSRIGIYLDFEQQLSFTTATIPYIEAINRLLANIERMRLWCATYLTYMNDIPGFVEIEDNWTGGHLATSPFHYLTVNSWEQVIDIMYNELTDYSVTRKPRTNVASCNSGTTRNNKWRHY